MSKLSKPELSKKNPYWIDKHRYYELKYFCLQYPTWKKAYVSLDGMSKKPEQLLIFAQTGACGDPTARCALAKTYYYERIAMLEHTAIETDKELGSYILIGVTEGCSYDVLRVRHNIPCCKDTYYELYRKFFWLLSQALANSVVKAKQQDNPDMDKKEVKKASNQAIIDARISVGASGKDTRIRITDSEWKAIQAGAISDSMLTQILRYADADEIRQRATPRATTELSTAKINKINSMLNSGFTNAEIAEALGVSTSTVSKYANQ